MSPTSTGFSKDERKGLSGRPKLPPFAGWPIEYLQIITLDAAAELASCSVDTLKRHHREKLVRLGPRRLGMRRGDALMLSESA
jgi:hypothetical protein